MKKQTSKLIVFTGLLGLGLGAVSCDDIIEPDISSRRVTLLTPADSSRSTKVVQTFRWEAMSGARQYRIRLAAPSLTNPNQFFLDSLVSQPSLTHSLAPGHYYWQVQAVNGSYSTLYSTRQFQLDSTGTLSGQTLQLLLPLDNSLSRGGTVTLSWSALPMAQRYLLQLTPNPHSSSGASLDTLLGNVTAVDIHLPARSQVYQWKVTALNATSLVNSATRKLEVDVLAPPAPTLAAPAAAASFPALPVTLSWTRGATDVTRDSVFIFQADQTSLFTGFPRLNASTSLELASPAISLAPGTYYWAIRSVDRAGNASPLSAKRQLIMQ